MVIQVLLALLAGPVGSGARAPGPAPAVATETPTCAPAPWGLDAIVAPGSITIFGEIHGTTEIPRFVAEAACRAAETGAPVIVGLELPREVQAPVDRFLRSDGGKEAVDALLEAGAWSYLDGRASVAMLALLDRLRVLRRAGRPVSACAFDADYDSRRDERMAANLDAAIRATPDAVVLVLVGNVHARSTLPFMAAHLRQAHPHLRSLDARHAGGTAWLSTPEGTGELGIGGTDLDASPFIDLLPEPDGGYDGTFYVGQVSASPPARSRR